MCIDYQGLMPLQMQGNMEEKLQSEAAAYSRSQLHRGSQNYVSSVFTAGVQSEKLKSC